METKKERWFRLIRIREIEIENRKKRARWRRTEASNQRSILSKRKRRPDLLTPPASSLFHWSLRRRVFANRKVAASKSQSTSVRLIFFKIFFCNFLNISILILNFYHRSFI
ncbi:hypothetical protein YC2023_048587 [Brassica napus]